MRFAHVSDFHLTDRPENCAHVRDDILAAFDRLVTDLHSIEKHLDFIAVTGDVTEFGDAGSYERVLRGFEDFRVPVFLVPGNHDLREPFRETWLGRLNLGAQGPLDFEARLGTTQVIGLDTLVEGRSQGRLGPEQIEWLERRLLDAGSAHSVVLLHHAPFETGLAFFDNLSQTEGRDAFGEVIGRAPSEVILLCGHTHRPYQGVWRGAKCYVAGSLASQYGGVEPFGDCKVGVVDEPYAYFIHTLGRRGDHVVATRYLDLSAPNRG